MSPYAGYLFDLDGTLVDTAPDLNAALNRALTGAGLAPVSEALTRHWVGHGARVLIEQALHHQGGSPGLADDLHEAFLDHYQRHIADLSRPYPHVVSTLATLRARGAKLAVVTNKRTSLTRLLLDALDLTARFDAVVCGDTAALPKPAADPALYACEALGLQPKDVLFVGDSETDVACARAAGCAVVCVPDGYNHGVAPEALGADAVIRSFRDLIPAAEEALDS
jgi:phosphoglycolate phosphatase